MELLLKAKLENIFKAKDFINKSSGEIESKGKWKVEFMERIESEDGFQTVIHNVSIPDDKIDQYRKKVGEEVTIPVKSFVNGRKVGYYGI
jgi:hypothetical protein